MKISSKSILSPGRAGATRDPPNSLSTSLSRRLRNSGSIKGGASPAMFPTTAKKRGSFENPEPSSPKVTCIGQVRVKSKKKQAKKLRTLSRKQSSGEVSFRKVEHPLDGFSSKPQNQHESFNLGSNGTQNHQQNPDQECSPAQRSWVHFPVTICDTLRAFGSEFSCLFPCRKEKMVTMEEGNHQGSCGAVFARWLVAVQDGYGGAEREIELAVGEEQEESVFKKPRRHVFEDLEIINDGIEGRQDESRVSICIPPKNALLLMRCRADPMKVEALTNRSWEPTLKKNEEEDEETAALKEPQENLENEAQNQENDNVEQDEANQDQEHENVLQDEANQEKDQEHENVQQDEDQENLENEAQNQENVNVEEDEANQDQAHENVQQDEAGQDQDQENVQDEVGQAQDKELTDEEDESLYLGLIFDENVNQDFEIEEMVNNGVLEKESEMKEERETEKVLPECLLMMMYEPKLSMEVSKETWVCSRDFIKPHSNRRKLPPPPPPARPRAVVQTDGGDQQMVSGPANATVDVMMRVADGGYQPVRSSCSYPAPPSMATVIEQKLAVADAVGYEPFVLTRCKSEPMKMAAAAKLLPESCVWENRKLERLSRVEFCIGGAGLGF